MIYNYYFKNSIDQVWTKHFCPTLLLSSPFKKETGMSKDILSSRILGNQVLIIVLLNLTKKMVQVWAWACMDHPMHLMSLFQELDRWTCLISESRPWVPILRNISQSLLSLVKKVALLAYLIWWAVTIEVARMVLTRHPEWSLMCRTYKVRSVWKELIQACSQVACHLPQASLSRVSEAALHLHQWETTSIRS